MRASKGLLLWKLAVKEGDTLRVVFDETSRAGKHDPFGNDWHAGNRGTSRLEEAMQSGDELWTWSTGEWSWREMAGRAGYALVRNGEVVDSTWTIMN
jgi:hypothetical protein